MARKKVKRITLKVGDEVYEALYFGSPNLVKATVTKMTRKYIYLAGKHCKTEFWFTREEWGAWFM